MSAVLGKTCAACGIERKPKSLKYDANTLLPYCNNPYVCSEKHPNAPENLIMRGRELHLVDYDQANAAFQKQLIDNYDFDMVEKISRLLKQPFTMRVLEPDMAQFLVEFEQEMGFGSTSDVVRHCVRMMMENRNAFGEAKREAQNNKRKNDNVSAVVAAVSQPTPAPTKTEEPTPEPKQEAHTPAPKQPDSFGTF